MNPGKCHNGTESSRVTITFGHALVTIMTARRVAAAAETVHDSDWFDSSDSDWTRFHWSKPSSSDLVPFWSDLMTVPTLDLEIYAWPSSSSCNLGFLKLWEALSVVDGETFCGDRRLLAYSVITVVACWTGCVDGRHTWSHLRSSATWKDGLCDGGKGGAGGREKLGRFRGTRGPAFVFCLCVLDCSVEFACVRACMDGVCVDVCVHMSVKITIKKRDRGREKGRINFGVLFFIFFILQNIFSVIIFCYSWWVGFFSHFTFLEGEGVVFCVCVCVCVCVCISTNRNVYNGSWPAEKCAFKTWTMDVSGGPQCAE